jgi:trimeric autotransporter adhesin
MNLQEEFTVNINWDRDNFPKELVGALTDAGLGNDSHGLEQLRNAQPENPHVQDFYNTAFSTFGAEPCWFIVRDTTVSRCSRPLSRGADGAGRGKGCEISRRRFWRVGSCWQETGKLLGGVSLMLLLGIGLSWAGGPPNPTPSDSMGNTAGGTNSLFNNTSVNNTAFGESALASNNTGGYNTSLGAFALSFNTMGNYNTALGNAALASNSTGNGNTASGFGALSLNMGNYNTGSGFQALVNNSGGDYNTASGVQALLSNTSGRANTASGAYALYSNQTGDYNTVSGVQALYFNTGDGNTASGYLALFSNTGDYNTGSGVQALFSNTTGTENTAVGVNAGLSNTTGNHNTFIGTGADANAGTYTNGTALGFGAQLKASNSIVLGNSSISRIYANVTAITAISDRRRKKDIRALNTDLGLDFIEKLEPVSYRFNNGDETERYGFVAQDLEQALPASLHDTIQRSEPEHRLALIERQNDEDRTYRVSYGELFAPIVKSIQQQQQEIEAERQQIAALKAENDALRYSIAALKEQVTATR